MSKVAKWIFPVAGGVKGVVGTALAVVGFATGNTGLILSGASMVAGAGKKTQGQARQASILSLTLGETQREAAIGLVCTGGSLVDVFNFGGQYGTDKVTRCVALADHAIDGMVGFYIDDTYYPWVGEGLQAAFSNKLSFHFRQATADGHAPPQHVLENGGWVATDRMVGITHIWIDWYVDEKVWPQGHPAIRFVFRGLRVYDPRFDPALGYTGPNPQTWADRSTHRFSRNAKVLRYAYTRGIYAEGHHGDPNYLLIGRGLTAEEAPPERVIADANLCDEIVDGVARYCADGVISASQQFIEVDGMFAAAMAGQIVQREGSVDVEAGQAKAVVATITDDDLVVGEPVSFSRFLPDNDGGRINTLIGRYIEPSLGFKDQSAPVRRSLTDIQSDGGPREQTLSLPLVTEVKQVDRVIEIQRLMARLERRASIVLPPKFAGLEEGDWIAWQSNRRHHGATVRYQVQAYRQPETWRMYLTLREIASSVFGVPDPVEDFVTPPPPPVPIDALALTGVTAEAITLPGDSSAVPAIRFRWDAPVDAAVLAIRAEVRRVGETETAPTRTEQVNDGVMVATNGVGPDQSLQARLVPIGDPSRPVLPSAWITVSTSGLVAGDVSPNAPGLSQIRSDIQAAFGDIFDIDALLSDTRSLVDAQGVEIAAARGDQPNLGARVAQLAQATYDGDEANAQAIDQVRARTLATEADIIDLENALATETGARAQAIQQVRASIPKSANEFNNADFSQDKAGYRHMWGAANGVPLSTGVINRSEFLYGVKNGGANYEGSDYVAFASLELGGGSFSIPGQNYERAFRVAAGERIGFAFDGRPSGGTPSYWTVVARLYNNDNTWADRSWFAESDPYSTDWVRSGFVITVPSDGYIGFEAYLRRKGTDVNSYGDAHLRGVTFARLSAQATEVPAYTAPAASGGLASLSGSITQQSLAIIDLENQQALAYFGIKAEATGSRPTILELFSGVRSAIALTADQIYFGDNSVFDDATDTLQTSVGPNIRVLAFGSPFGAQGNLLEWWGPASTPLGEMTTGNGLNGRMTSAPYVFDNVIGGGKTGGTRSFSSGPGGTTASSIIPNVLAGSLIEMSGALNGGSISSTEPLYGTLSLYEASGGNQTLVHEEPVTIVSNGLVNPGGSYGAEGASVNSPRKFATRSGNVTYTVTFVRTGGSSYVNGATLSGGVIITPPA